MANATSTNQNSSEQQIEAWHVGDKCLAPISERGKFAEATIHSLKSDEYGITFAGVLFSGSEQKKYFPLTELCKVQDSKDPWKRVIFDDADLEKPSFPDKAHSGPTVALSLSDAGDCIPYTINRYLRDYQREGVQFMYKHYIESRGCILGDDMGLGKTVQVISFLAAVLHKKGTREDIENNMPEFLLRTMKKQSLSVTPKKMFLIVAPLSVLYNWKDELDTWGYFRVITLHGTKKDTNLSRVKQGKCEIALTTYETLRLCLDELNSITWSAVIVDEAHRIKNPKAQVTQVMKDLKCRVRIGLTGTILQNNMEELWCVLDWALPEYLGSRKQFKEQFSSPVEYGQRHNATKRELATGRKAMQRLVRKMSMFFLRRTKAIISHQLPKKEDRIVYCSLTDFQRAVYQTVLETEDVGLVLRARESCSCGSKRKRKNCCYKMNAYGETVSALYFSYLAILRKVANHAVLLQTDSSTSKKQDTLIKRVCSQVFSKFPDFVKQSKDAAFETLSDPMYSGKMKVLQQLLNHFRKNKDKVLLFSFSTKLLDVLERYCMASGLDYRRLDGNTKPEDRFKIVKEFNGAPDVNICLVSTMAGGLGLNFVGANVVVVFDPTWNPANDLQAIDRAYRIGQCRDVKVFRLISLGTVEEIVYLRQVYKQQLHCVVVGSENAKRYFEAVQGSKEHQGELFGVHNLFKLRSRGSCLTREILEREGQVEAGFVTAATRLRENIPSNKSELPLDAEGGDLDHLMPRGEVEKETFDFNSDSEEEAKATSKTKSTKSRVSKANTAVNPKEQLTLLQCGFSKLLEKAPKSDDEDTDSSSNTLDDNKQFPTVVKSVNKTTSRKCDTSLNLNVEMPTVDFQPHADFQKQNAKQDISRLRKHSANWELLSDTEEESDSTNSHQDRSVVLNIVRETESGSDESADVILPSKEPVQDKMVVSKKATAYETPSEQSEDSDAETHTAFTTTGNRQGISKELVFPSVSSFFGKTKSNSVTKAQKSKPGTGTDAISDESDDIEISEQPKRRICSSLAFKQMKDKRRGLHCRRSCLGSDSQIIDTFSSSEEDLPTKKVRPGKLNQRQQIQKRTTQIKPPATKHTTDRKVGTEIQHPPTSRQNTAHKKETTVRNEAESGSLDRILGGVQEVAYFHSNQNVVGSSKAENHMSRRAVRDVFELKQFSQVPANVAVINSQKFEELSDDDISETSNKQRERKEHFKDIHLYVTHPVTQKARRVHHAGPNTYLIGETPRAIRRKQFEEMVSRFKMASAEELAEHIVAAKSEKRQQMLRDFYASKWPEVEELFTVQVPVELPNDFEREEEYRLKSKKKKNRFKGSSSVSRVTGSENSWSDTNSKVNFNESEGDSSSRLTQDDASQQLSQTSRELMLSRFTRCKSMTLEDTSISKVTENNLGMESPIKTLLPKTEGKKLGCHTAEKDSIADLLGDTSILSDLFSSRGSSPATSTRMPHSELPTRKAKARTKDFWDILNEQNDESFSKLTDLSVTEKVCERASLAVAKKKEKYDDSLWKKNENFLWRKYDPRDDRGQGT